MNPSRTVIIAVAGVAAVLLALLVHALVSKPKAPPPAAAAVQEAPMTRVLTAKVALAPGDRLSADNMAWQPWPATTVNAAYITDGVTAAAKPAGAEGAVRQASTAMQDMASGGGPRLQAMIGSIVRDTIFAGEPITSTKVVRAGDSGYMAVRLPEGMRAFSIPVSVESGAGGFIQPGDRVDIMASHPDTSKNNGGMIAEQVLGNIQVLAVDQRTDTPKGATAAPLATLTLEVPEADVETLVRAKTAGQLMMALRSYADIGGGPSRSAGANHQVRIFRGGAPAETVTAQ